MKEFTNRLVNIDDSYYAFVVAVLTYVKKKPSRFESVRSYMDKNPQAKTYDILNYISDQEDFYEDAEQTTADAVSNTDEGLVICPSTR